MLFHWISWLFICIKVGFMYFLRVNIFISPLVGLSVCFHFENHRDNLSREFCKSFLVNQELSLVLLLKSHVHTHFYYKVYIFKQVIF